MMILKYYLKYDYIISISWNMSINLLPIWDDIQIRLTNK